MTRRTLTIEEEYRAKHPTSQARYERALRDFPSGVTHDVRYQKPFPSMSRTRAAPASGTSTGTS